MKRVGVYAKKNNPDAALAAREVVDWLEGRGIEVVLEETLARCLNQGAGLGAKEVPGTVDAIVVLGGDGTLISVARKVGGRKVPILGINLGSLGFLTEVTRAEAIQALEKMLEGSLPVSSRMMLDAVVRRKGEEVGRFTVLNDVVINKGALARIIDMEASIDGAYLTTYKADGLIISSPTGSTAYNISAGGPVISPNLNCLVIAPICPHTLTNRPIIVGADVLIRIEVKFRDEDVVLTADGQVGMPLEGGDVVEVRRSPQSTYLLTSPSKDYFQILRTKLRWGER